MKNINPIVQKSYCNREERSDSTSNIMRTSEDL